MKIIAIAALSLTSVFIVAFLNTADPGWIWASSNDLAKRSSGNWEPTIGWLHIFSDVAICLASLLILCTLILGLQKNDAVPFRKLFWLLVVFFSVCSLTHAMDAVMFWWPAYVFWGLLQFATAIVCVITSIALAASVPAALGLRSPQQTHDGVERQTHESEVAEFENAERQAQQIVEASPVSMIVVDAKGKIRKANRATEDLFGYSSAELLDQSIDILVPTRFRPSHLEQREEYTKSPETRAMGKGRDLFGLHKSGEEIPLEIGLSMLQASQGDCVLCCIVDLTERKRGERTMREANRSLESSQLILRGLIDNSRNFLGLLRCDGTVLDANRTAIDAVGVSPDDVLNRPFWETVWWSHSEALQDQLKDAIEKAATGKAQGFEAIHLTDDGSKLIIDFSLSPVFDASGKVAYLIPEGRDITEHKQRQAELHRLNEELLRSNQDLEQFAYVASHDLQEPLRKITSFAKLLREECEDQVSGDGQQYLEIMVDGAQRMRALISDLLAFSRVTTQGGEFSPVDAGDCLKAAVANLELVIKESDARVSFGELAVVSADGGQLMLLFQNLVENAIKYRRSGVHPCVDIRCEPTDHEWVQFSVQDNGIGIREENREAVFEIFRRLHSRSEFDGTGIGLAICKRIVDRMGGKIWVDSSFGEGSTFHFTLKQVSRE